MTTDFSVAVLAGGSSRRMGRDKATVRLEPDGPSLLDLVIERVAPLSEDCFLVTKPDRTIKTGGLPVAHDEFGETGVLGAMATAISRASKPSVLIVSCDMPFLDPKLLAFISTSFLNYDVVVPTLNQPSAAQGTEKVYQSLHARYHKRCLPAIRQAMERGDLRTVSFFPMVSVKTVPESVCRTLDPTLRSFLSVNDQAALDMARCINASTKTKNGPHT